MPTVKKSLAMRQVLDEDQINFFLTGVDFVFFWDEPERERDWRTVRDEILANWIRERPGTRPAAWWLYDAPRWARKFGAYFDGTLPEPRLRIGGIGTPSFEALNIVPAFDHGIPRSWISLFDVSYYNGRAEDIHGNRIGTEYAEGHFPYQAIDPADPPAFESQAAYLKRHRLFLLGEENRIPAEAWEPEVVRC